MSLKTRYYGTTTKKISTTLRTMLCQNCSDVSKICERKHKLHTLTSVYNYKNTDRVYVWHQMMRRDRLTIKAIWQRLLVTTSATSLEVHGTETCVSTTVRGITSYRS